LTSSPTADGTPDVPTQIFEKFLQALEGAGQSAEIITRLRKALLEDQAFTENALKKAVLGENTLP
jgi:hypothetical protein